MAIESERAAVDQATPERMRATMIGHHRPPRHPQLRAFDTTERGELVMRFEAFGMTLERVLELQTENVAYDDGTCNPRDLVVWEGPRAVAVIHYRGLGVGDVTATVTRLDGDQGEDPEVDPESRWTTEAPGQGEAVQLKERIPEAVTTPDPDPAPAEDPEGDEPDEWEDGWVDDSVQVIDTRPGRPVPEGRWKKRKLPLLRATHTLCAPWDNWPVSVEMVVLASEGAGDRTASVGDLPDLSLAGWHDHQYGPLTIYLRVVVA